MLIRLSIPGKNAHGGPNPHPAYGDQLSERANPGVAPEGHASITYTEVKGTYADGETFSLRQPTYNIQELGYGPLGDHILMSPRVAPQMIGLGLLQSVPDETLLALADPDDKDGDGISGRVNMVWNQKTQQPSIGRFGWKANQPSLHQQNAGAALGDIGLTTTVNAHENCTAAQQGCTDAINGGAPEIPDEFLAKLTLYTMTLAVPQQRNADAPEVRQGEALFREFGCASCHMPSMKTGENAEFPQVSNADLPRLHRPAAARHGRRSWRQPPRLRGDRTRMAHTAAVGSRPRSRGERPR